MPQPPDDAIPGSLPPDQPPVPMTQQEPPPKPLSPPSGNAAGACALIAIGLLFLIPSGLCTAFGVFGIGMELLKDPGNAARDFEDIIDFAIPTLGALAVGIALIWASVRVGRGR